MLINNTFYTFLDIQPQRRNKIDTNHSLTHGPNFYTRKACNIFVYSATGVGTAAGLNLSLCSPTSSHSVFKEYKKTKAEKTTTKEKGNIVARSGRLFVSRFVQSRDDDDTDHDHDHDHDDTRRIPCYWYLCLCCRCEKPNHTKTVKIDREARPSLPPRQEITSNQMGFWFCFCLTRFYCYFDIEEMIREIGCRQAAVLKTVLKSTIEGCTMTECG